MAFCEQDTNILPSLAFVAGGTQNLQFNAFRLFDKRPFDLGGCICNFSVTSCNNRTGKPLISKQMTVTNLGGSAYDNILRVSLTPVETARFNGKYIYQITITDAMGETEIPGQGALYVSANIDKAVLP